MGVTSSRTKKGVKEIIIENSNATDENKEFNMDISDNFIPTDEYTFKIPKLKWHKANPSEQILQIQQEAEIRDIETIYENSSIKDKDLLNRMPDHYWSGRENRLPRYVRYRGEYPDGNFYKMTNLQRIKSSSLNDLTESMSFYFIVDEYLHSDSQSLKYRFRSISCPYLKTLSMSSLFKNEKDTPIKGILKSRKTTRPNSALIMDNRDKESASVDMGTGQLITVTDPYSNSQCPDDSISHTGPMLNFPTKKTQTKSCFGKGFSCISSNKDDDDTLSGYFDQSPTHLQDSDILRVNANKKSWIKINLNKRLHLRPSSMDLAHRNILHEQDEYDRLSDFEQTRCLINEKLSERPTLTELKKKRIIKFSDFVEIQETDNYDRSITRTWGRLTEVDKETIRTELNEFKDKEMAIHLNSRKFTKFHDSYNE